MKLHVLVVLSPHVVTQLLWTTSEYMKEKWDDAMGVRFQSNNKERPRSR